MQREYRISIHGCTTKGEGGSERYSVTVYYVTSVAINLYDTCDAKSKSQRTHAIQQTSSHVHADIDST